MRFDIWKSERERAEVLPCGLRVLRGQTRAGKPTAWAWNPKASNPYARVAFPDEARREAWIAEQVAARAGHQRMVAERKAARRGEGAASLEPVEVGDIFDYSWGYEQTNVDFFQVVERSGRRVVVREVAQEHAPGPSGGMSAMVTPVKDKFLEGRQAKTLSKVVQFTEDGRAYLSFEFGFCPKWDGTPQFCSWYA